MKLQPYKHSRRQFLKSSKIAASAAVISTTACTAQSTPTPVSIDAVANPSAVLSSEERMTIAAYGETLAPGARAAGIATFVTEQLAKPSSDCLLMIRYLGVPPPYLPLYKTWIASLQTAAEQRHQQTFTKLSPEQQIALADDLAADKVEDWEGPPASFFHFVLRADATDLVYGTVDGFKRLNVPYLAHIAPSSNW